MITASRYHDFCAGHRVVGQGGKCEHLHGHNYRVHFTIAGALDEVGRVLDFSVIKTTLCEWLETHWDHKFLLWGDDPWFKTLVNLDIGGVKVLPFNPTAENMAQWLVEHVGPEVLPAGVFLTEVTIDETRKCSATYTKGCSCGG